MKILECRREQGQVVIPVFYKVDPSDIRNQRKSYEEAFAKHERDTNNRKHVSSWRAALKEAANISPAHTGNNYLKRIQHVMLNPCNTI